MGRTWFSTTLAIPSGFRITTTMSVTPLMVMSQEPRSNQSSGTEPRPPGARLAPKTAPRTPPATALSTALIDSNDAKRV